MRYKVKIALLGFCILFVFNSCKNELDILAPYKESISVYAVLNPQEKFQFIRVNKVFLGEGNAFDMAQVKDSVNYPLGVLTGKLERFINGVKAVTTQGDSKAEIILKDTVMQIKSGVFNTMQHFLFTADKLYTSGEYKLTITNSSTGNVFTSQTTVIDSIAPTPYQPLRGKYYFELPFNNVDPQYNSYFIEYSNTAVTRNVRFATTTNAVVYSLTIRFHYQDSVISGQKIDRFVDYSVPTFKVEEKSATLTEHVYSFMSPDLYSRWYNEIIKTESENVLFRKAVKMDFIVYAGTRDYHDFLQISAPSTSVAQDKPVYSNINGGFGILAARSRHHISKAISPVFIDYISQTKPMCSLRFLKSNGTTSQVCN